MALRQQQHELSWLGTPTIYQMVFLKANEEIDNVYGTRLMSCHRLASSLLVRLISFVYTRLLHIQSPTLQVPPRSRRLRLELRVDGVAPPSPRRAPQLLLASQRGRRGRGGGERGARGRERVAPPPRQGPALLDHLCVVAIVVLLLLLEWVSSWLAAGTRPHHKPTTPFNHTPKTQTYKLTRCTHARTHLPAPRPR